MANKNIKYTSGDPKTPRFQLVKQSNGEFTINYGEHDPLGARKKISANADEEVQRLFGYQSWRQYKDENTADLNKKIVTDPETGQRTQAPTVQPFHVAYGLEEFIERFDPNEYEIVGIPASVSFSQLEEAQSFPEGRGETESWKTRDELEDRSLFGPQSMNVIGKKLDVFGQLEPEDKEGDPAPSALPGKVDTREFYLIHQMRKNFFGDDQSPGAAGKFGILNIATFFPQEQLLNKDVIIRVKKRYDFNKIFTEKFMGEMAVKHLNGKYWKADAKLYDDVTDNLGDALKIDVQSAIANSSFLKEQYEYTGQEGGPGALDWRGLEQDIKSHVTFDEDTWDWIEMGVVGIQVLDPTGVLSYPDVYYAHQDWNEKPSLETAGYFALSVLGAIPLIGKVTKIDKIRQLTAHTDDIARALKASPVSELAQIGDRIADAGQTMKGLGRHSSEKVLGRLSDDIAKGAEHLRAVPTRAGRAFAHEAGKLRDISNRLIDPNVVTRSTRMYGAGRGRFAAQAVGDIGVETFDKPTPLDRVRAEVPWWRPKDTEGTEGTPSFPISISNLKFYILPKQWRERKWLTETEDILAQRIGANTNFLASPERREEAKTSLKETNILIFGHSQAGRYGKGLRHKIKAGGGKVTKKVIGVPDPGLVKHIKNIKGEYTHAYLFLGGNTAAPHPNHIEAKKEIINHVMNRLNVPRENILVILPPINLNKEYSRGRISLNRRATKFFKSKGIKVHPPVVGTKEDFSKDGFHIRSNSRLVSQATEDMLSIFSQTASEPIPKETFEKPAKHDIANIIAQEAQKAGIDPVFAISIAMMESNLNPHANMNNDKNAKGLFQFLTSLRGAWAEEYGMDFNKVYDARYNSQIAMKMIKKKIKNLARRGIIRRSTASNVDPEEAYLIYLSWQQGLDGITQIHNAAARGTEVVGPGIILWSGKSLVWKEKKARTIRRNMRGNFNKEWPGRGDDPENFLNVWKSRTLRIISNAKTQYASALAGSKGPLAESIYLKYLLDEIENIDNELV